MKSVLVFWFLFSVAWFAGAQELATNPGFETGDTTGWSGFGTPTLTVETTQVHSGSYACLVTNRTQTYMGAAQSFTSVLQSGQTYNVSAWVRLVNGVNQPVHLTFAKTDGSGTSYTQAAANTATASGWTQVAGQYTLNVSGTLSSLTLYCELTNSATGAYYIDDLSVQLTNVPPPPPPPPTNGQCTVDWSNTFQRIDGFGASSAWDGSWTTAQADMLFSTNIGCGLSLLRNHITYAGSTSSSATLTTAETSIMQMAQARGARVWSTPWTPAVGFKRTNDIYDSLPITNAVNGGTYLGSGNNATNQAYASQLANYVSSMKNSYGVNIYALSIQNEPDASVNTYEACQWTGQQIHDFATNLSTALAAKGFGSTKIILPESQNWTDPHNLMGPTLGDPNAASDVSIIADHNYVANNGVGDQTTPAAINTSGKGLWETEVALLSGSDSSINNALYWAGRIHLFLTAAQANAWHYWWLVASGNEGLMDTSGNAAKRMYALGQFARFVRPNFFRINVPTNSGPVQISAYKDSMSPAFAIVAVNPSSFTVTQAVSLVNVTGVSSVTPWITSASMSLSNQTPVAVSGSTFTYTLPALSVVTFAGQSAAVNPSPAATILSLATSSSSSTYGSPVTFTATVKNNGTLLGVSGEPVAFYIGGVELGTGVLNGNGQAAFTTSARQLAVGSYSVMAGYGGDFIYSGSTNSTALSQTVNPATVTAGLTGSVGKIYDGSNTATLAPGNYTLTGVVSGDSVALNNPASGTYDSPNQGTGKTVFASGLAISGTSVTNYTLASTSASGAVGMISAATLTYTANAASMIYGSVVPGLSGSVSGFVGNDTQGNATTGTLTFTTAATSSSGVGNYAINGTGLSANNGNYIFGQAAGNATALTINPLVAILTGSRPYDGTTVASAGVLSVANTIGGDSVMLASGGVTLAGANIGSQAITSLGNLTLGGAAMGNYTLSGAGGTVNIAAAGLTVTNLLALNKVYDGTTNAMLNATNAGLSVVYNGDDVSLVVSNAVGFFADKSVGTNKPVTVTGLAISGASIGNYSLIPPVPMANITPVDLTVTNVLALSKVYDGTTIATLDATNAGLVGVLSGDDATLAGVGAVGNFADANVGANKSVTVTGYAVTGADGGNYILTQPMGLTADILPLVTPVFSNPAISQVAGGWQLSLSGQSGQNYHILATTNLALPLNQWTVITNGTFGSNAATVSDPVTGISQRFYLIVSP